MDQNTQPNNNIPPLIWIIIGVLSATVIFAGGYILATNSAKPQSTESVELKNPTTVDDEIIPVPTAEPNNAPETPDPEVAETPNLRMEIVLDADALANAIVGTAPASSDGIIYQADVYEYLTLRSAPSTSATALILLPPYTRMQIIEHSDATMAKVYLIDSHQEGYVNKEYISPEGSVMKRAGKKPSVSITDNTIYYADVYESLTLRNAASTSAKEIGFLYSYAAMHLLERSGKMAYVYALDSGMTGWVNTEYIVSDISSCIRAGRPVPSSNSTSNPYGLIVGEQYFADVNEFLTLRNSPNTSGKEIKKLPRYTILTIIEITNSEFSFVAQNTTGQKGYVMSKHLTEAAENLGDMYGDPAYPPADEWVG